VGRAGYGPHDLRVEGQPDPYGPDPEGVLVKARAPTLAAGREEDNGNPGDHQGSACPVITIGLLPVDAPAPQERGDDEHATIRRIDPAEIVALLEGRNNAVQNQDDRAQDADDDRCPVAEPSPDQVAAANLGQSGSDDKAAARVIAIR